jgi:hypothetical protein
MRKSMANAILLVGWPPLSETLEKLVAKRIPILARGACSPARGVTDLSQIEAVDYKVKL